MREMSSRMLSILSLESVYTDYLYPYFALTRTPILYTEYLVTTQQHTIQNIQLIFNKV